MSKILKLFINENIKIIKKKSTVIMLILSILVLIGAVGLAYLMKYTNQMDQDFYASMGDYKEVIKQEIANTKQEMKIKENNNNSFEYDELKAKLEKYELALENDIDIINYSTNSWKDELLSKIDSLNYDINSSKYLLSEEEIKEKENEKQKLINILKTGNFKQYIEAQIKDLKEEYNNKKIEKDEYEFSLYILQLTEKYEIGKTGEKEEEWKQNILNEITELKEGLRTNINTITNKILTPKEIKKYEDALKIDEYRLENNMPTIETYSDYRNIYDYIAPRFSMAIVAIMVIIIAGGTISTEISKGTIKFLTFTPNKRWKILFSKILSTTIILILVTIMLAILSNIIGNIAFPNNKPQDYLYVENEEVRTISHGLYMLLYYLATSIDIFVFIIFAIMLSVITRNTAVSVSISIGTYVGSGMIMTMINTFIKKDWVKFIPFNNLSIVDKIFPNQTSYIMQQTTAQYMNNVSLQFSLAVLAVCVFLMLVTMFDSFNNKDIN